MKIHVLNKIILTLLIVAAAFLQPIIIVGQENHALPQLGKSPLKEVIAAMTLEEKASLVVGAGIPANSPLNPYNPEPGTLAAQTKDYVPGAVGRTLEIPRLGITSMVMNDGPAGVGLASFRPEDKKTAFPVATLLASTWDKELIYQLGQSYGNEILEYGLDILLTPAMNIHRNPLTGRNFEYYSEDPFLSGKIAAAMVMGIQSQGVGTSVKHFVANNQETNRSIVDAVISERALREIYLEGFRIAVEEAKPWTIMASYNSINGSQATENNDLLTNVLRNDWDFQGLVMTDWGAGTDPVAQMEAGLNLIMPGPHQAKDLVQAVKDGKLNENVLDQHVEIILNTVLQTPRFKQYQFSNNPDLAKHIEMARQVAAEGMVLLKNDDDALPILKDYKNLALFGNASYETIAGGSGSGYVPGAPPTVNIVDGLKNAGYNIDEQLHQIYSNYIEENTPEQNFLDVFRGRKKRPAEMKVDMTLAEQLSDKSDLAVVTIQRNSGETKDRNIDDDFNLSEAEKKNLKNITDAFHARGRKVIVVLNTGGVVETVSWRDLPDAILIAWQPGQEAGNAVADVLSGTVNPSGKLPATFPVKYEDVPSAKNFPGTPAENPEKVVYEEGIYVGYRNYNTFGVQTAYPFGYGLSYTEFTYSDLKLSSSKFIDSITASVTITNSGNVAGREVVQLYLSAPADELDKPSEELKGFAKTGLLKPGESQTLTFTIGAKELASFNSDQSAWIADKGKYSVKIGASCEDIKLTKSFRLKTGILVEKVSKALVPQYEINELVMQ